MIGRKIRALSAHGLFAYAARGKVFRRTDFNPFRQERNEFRSTKGQTEPRGVHFVTKEQMSDMVATMGSSRLPDNQRVVITGIGLTAPNGNSLPELRESLLQGRSGVKEYEIRYFGKTLAGTCQFEVSRHQAREDVRRGTRAGSVGIYCGNEAVKNSGLDWPNVDKSRVGVYIGVTEHGNVETENEIHELKNYNYDTSFWSHHHNPRTVANNPAGELALNMGITGPHYTIGAACAAGNAGLIQGARCCG